MKAERILQVALPTPLSGSFDYLPPRRHRDAPVPLGTRVRVPFGRREVVGVVVGLSATSRVAPDRLRPISRVIDTEPVLEPPTLELLGWASAYYHHPLGEVIVTALPKRLRAGRSQQVSGRRVWTLTAEGRALAPNTLARAPRQAALLADLRQAPDGMDPDRLRAIHTGWQRAMQGLKEKGLVQDMDSPCLETPTAQEPTPALDLNPHQRQAVEGVRRHLGGFSSFVLDGVTGSGKTEVYLHLIETVIQDHLQALVLVPEIGLTPQLVERFRRRLRVPLAILHSGLSDTERHCAWEMARRGRAPVVLGTRSAVFAPLARPGIIVVDEEHDSSYKQQEGFRYHARDLAVFRARQHGIPIVLGSATPSLETLYNVERARYRRLVLPERTGSASHPILEVIDVRRRPLEDGVCDRLREEIAEQLEAGGQILLFLNRRGFAPALICHGCGWIAPCPRCDAFLTLHAGHGRLRCHHCGSEQVLPRTCPPCGEGDLRPVGQGTERVEQALRRWFPHTPVLRIDRDTTRRKGSMEARLEEIKRGEHQILVGTQMLSKGHHFPNVTLVGILDIDSGLYSTDFHAMERMAQLIIQVAGRAGRAERPGKVLLQTHQPEHPLLKTLLSGHYAAFAAAALAERRVAELPPYRHMAVLRTEAARNPAPMQFLDAARGVLPDPLPQGITVLGPAPAPMERRAGRYRAQLLVSARGRPVLKELLDRWMEDLPGLPGARRVRWSLDVDPIDLY
jgi:primosomal protein N' (replication factor Y)